MSQNHVPVLKDECLKQATEMSRPPKRYLDLTLGRGGHAMMFMQTFAELELTGVDQDIQALQETEKTFKDLGLMNRANFHHVNFHNWSEYAKTNHIALDFDLILMDLGVSSPQLDNFERGFSFYNDGPLDMRMNQTQELKAADIVNQYSEEDLNDIFRSLGEVQNPTRVSREIVARRGLALFQTTLELSKLIEAKEGGHKKGSHPATRYFLALRMAVNNELQGLEDSLDEIMDSLSKGGRLLVLTFHSLEDRIVKYKFKESKVGFPVTKKVIKPSREEILSNPRSRSALLRVFEKGEKNEKRNKYK